MNKLAFLIVLCCSSVHAADWWEVKSCTVHDLDTWTDATIEIPFIDQQLVRRSLRLHDCDAAEVAYNRQATLLRQGAVLITPAEIAKGKEGTAKLEALAAGGKRYVKIVDYKADYNRHEVEMKIVTKTGVEINVKQWIEENGYLRPTK